MRVLVIGLDAFDPVVFERLYSAGRLPRLGKYVAAGKYSRFAVSNPPQSEVSWTSIATGLNPGAHGMFDFVHRNPANYSLHVSLLPTRKGWGGIQFARPYHAQTIFEKAVKLGYPATSLWWPAMFPAKMQSPVKSIPGLGTPDLMGKLGVGSFYTTASGFSQENGRKIPVKALAQSEKGRYRSVVDGPVRKKRKGDVNTSLGLTIDYAGGETATLQVGQQRLELQAGMWSPIVELEFKMGLFVSVKAITRFLLAQTQPDLSLYMLPLQIHPLKSPWHYGSPHGFLKKTWQECGPFLTVGWPQDTTALEENCMSDEQFLALCESIVGNREKILLHHLERFKEGVLGIVFDTLDRVQHMFWRDRLDVVEEWYEKFDALVGRIEDKLEAQGSLAETKIVILSDHGFASFDQKVHLNRWLLDQGYLMTKQDTGTGSLKDVDWGMSKAYAVGLNSVYLNLEGREGQGVVSPKERTAVLSQLSADLQQWRTPDGKPIAKKVWQRHEVFSGPLAEFGPDLLVGYAPGFRASAQTGLGAWEPECLEQNRDHWGADHCIEATAVPGVIFASHGLNNYAAPSYQDIPALTIEAVLDDAQPPSPPHVTGEEDETAVEERLKSLGYL